jgi:hypothetical protein
MARGRTAEAPAPASPPPLRRASSRRSTRAGAVEVDGRRKRRVRSRVRRLARRRAAASAIVVELGEHGTPATLEPVHDQPAPQRRVRSKGSCMRRAARSYTWQRARGRRAMARRCQGRTRIGAMRENWPMPGTTPESRISATGRSARSLEVWGGRRRRDHAAAGIQLRVLRRSMSASSDIRDWKVISDRFVSHRPRSADGHLEGEWQRGAAIVTSTDAARPPGWTLRTHCTGVAGRPGRLW